MMTLEMTRPSMTSMSKLPRIPLDSKATLQVRRGLGHNIHHKSWQGCRHGETLDTSPSTCSIGDDSRKEGDLGHVVPQRGTLRDALREDKVHYNVLGEDETLNDGLGADETLNNDLGEDETLNDVLGGDETLDDALEEDETLDDVLGGDGTLEDTLGEDKNTMASSAEMRLLVTT